MHTLSLDTAALLPGLRRFNIFRYLADNDYLELVGKGRLLSFAAGERIVTEGEISPQFYAILDGAVNIMVADRTGAPDGREVFICALGDGDVFGEAAIFTNKKRTASAVACTDATVLEIERDGLLDFIRARPAAGIRILMVVIHSLLNKLREANQELAFERKAVVEQQEVDDLINACFQETAGS